MKILYYILTLGCLGSLVSCSTLSSPVHTANRPVPRTSAQLKQEAADKAKKSAESAQIKEKARKSKPKAKKPKSKKPSKSKSTNKKSTAAKKKTKNTVKKKTTPAAPAKVKTATKVPGKTGFVFNPYTHNQVDVRGIPSGTKVRDPHDGNPKHIFRVP